MPSESYFFNLIPSFMLLPCYCYRFRSTAIKPFRYAICKQPQFFRSSANFCIITELFFLAADASFASYSSNYYHISFIQLMVQKLTSNRRSSKSIKKKTMIFQFPCEHLCSQLYHMPVGIVHSINFSSK